MSSPPASTLPVKILCPDGDLTLIMDEDPTHRFLVSRTVLTSASPVFRAIFSDIFSEATKNEIRIQDDDTVALLVLLQTAHLRFSDAIRAP